MPRDARSRLTILEARRLGATLGFAVIRQSPAGEVLQTVVYAAGRIFESIEAFEAPHPNGQIHGGLVFEDDGSEPAHSALMAAWFSDGGR